MSYNVRAMTCIQCQTDFEETVIDRKIIHLQCPYCRVEESAGNSSR
ncbi:hypothetical protein [Salimicrobium jeotgali]|nr:hypothetical protein [Salimicrobium jeotgali]MBM7695175.1 hypothetical protein [Salimicrobium jeotgali]